jgi:hypothetical protein
MKADFAGNKEAYLFSLKNKGRFVNLASLSIIHSLKKNRWDLDRSSPLQTSSKKSETRLNQLNN